MAGYAVVVVYVVLSSHNFKMSITDFPREFIVNIINHFSFISLFHYCYYSFIRLIVSCQLVTRGLVGRYLVT